MDAQKNFLKYWFLAILLVGSLMVAVNGQSESIESTPLINYLTATVIASSALIVRQFLGNHAPIPRLPLVLTSFYALGVVFVTVLRPSWLQELPRAVIMATSIWCGIMVGTCIGSNEKYIYQFARILLIFGVVLSLLSMFTTIGVVSALQSFSIGRSNRFWTTAFGVVDPVSMLAAGLVLCQNPNRPKYFQKMILFGLVSISTLLLLFSSTRSFLIQAFILLVVIASRKTSPVLRLLLILVSLLLCAFLTLEIAAALDIASIPVLNQFGFVDGNGEVTLEKSRGLLNDYLIETTIAHPFSGIGMNTIKEYVGELAGAAKTEYGYFLHMASFGVIVASPFYMLMFIGGFIQPMLSIVTSSKSKNSQFNTVNSMAIGAFLAGFNGYYGQATSITQFTYLIWIGIAISLNQSVLRKKKVNQSPRSPSKQKRGRLSGYRHDDRVDVN
jgi:hypothetical protein